MNSQQAINLLKGLEQSLDDYCELNDEGKAAFRMAITALELFGNSEQLPSAQPECKQKCMPMYADVSDYISRQETIKFLRDKVRLSTFMKRTVSTADKACVELCERIKNEVPPAQPEDIARDIATIIENEKDMRVVLKNAEPQWIPTSKTETIPDHEVLCCDRYENQMIGYLINDHGEWICESDSEVMYDTIAWMEKPEPYKGEGR